MGQPCATVVVAVTCDTDVPGWSQILSAACIPAPCLFICKSLGDNSSAWKPATCLENPKGVSGFWLQPSPAQQNQWMKDVLLSLSLLLSAIHL